MKNKILFICGSRPQIIKIHELSKHFDWINTGQHYDDLMNDVFMRELNIKEPIINFQCKNDLGVMITNLTEFIRNSSYETIVVIGDTNSTLAGALAAKQCRKKLVHIEAGCRSGNMEMIEEQNRIMIDQISDYLICPSYLSERILIDKEEVKGITAICGHLLLDAIWEVLPTKPIKEDYYLLTLHRAENVDSKKKLKAIFDNLGKIKGKIKFPIHPRTFENVKKFKLAFPENFELLEPQGFKEMINLEASAKKILTDSGGVQVEAHFLGVPCITLRDETEWKETLDGGWNFCVGVNDFIKLLDFKSEHMRKLDYGGNKKGEVSQKIITLLNNL